MTVKETAKLLAILKAAFPKDFPYNMSKDDAKITCIVWAEQFRNMPYEIVEIAVKKLISKEERISVAKVNKQIGALYWEAKEVLDSNERAKRICNGAGIDEQKIAFYEAIRDATKDYRCANEPSIAQIVGESNLTIAGEKRLLE